MWCIQQITAEYRKRMYALLSLYKEEYDPSRPIVCFDEKSKQLLEPVRESIKAQPGSLEKEDYEYKRMGTCNIFVAVEPKAGRRHIQVTARRTKGDFVNFIKRMLDKQYSKIKTVRLVLDNLNTHFKKTFEEMLPEKEAKRILKAIEFYYTPVHASWLNMAEIEINCMDRQCIGGKIGDKKEVASKIKAWAGQRNQENKKIDWRFTKQDADRKMSKYYVA